MALKYEELVRQSSTELNTKAVELKQELAKERAVIASGTRSEKPGKIRGLRRDIARIFTALNAVSKKKPAAAAKAPVPVKENKKGAMK